MIHCDFIHLHTTTLSIFHASVIRPILADSAFQQDHRSSSCSCLQPSIGFHSGAVPCRYGNLCTMMTMTMYVIFNFPEHAGVGVCGAQEEADSGERGGVAAAAGARVTGGPLPAAASRQHCAARRRQWSSQHCAAHILAQRGGVLLLWLQSLD